MRLILLAVMITLAGCASVPEQQRSLIKVTNQCLGKLPEKPIYSFDALPKPKTEYDAALAVQQLYLDFIAAVDYALKLEVAAAGCN